MKTHRILFVCLGNICRSPMAEYILRHQAAQAGIAHRIHSSSAGTSGWHDGEDMHAGTARTLKKHGINPNGFCSRHIQADDFAVYDSIIVMDNNNLAHLHQMFGRHPKIFKLTDLLETDNIDHVPDPWYTGDFDQTYRLCHAGVAALLASLDFS